MTRRASHIIKVRPANPISQDLIVIRPEDLGIPAGQSIVIHSEDLPNVPYIRPVPSRPIQLVGPWDNLRTLERRMLELINTDRAAHSEESGGGRPLGWDDAVAAVARAHSQDMIARRFMGHVNRAGLSPHDRLLQAGIACIASGENLAGGPTMRAYTGDSPVESLYTGYPSIEAAEQGLMNSPSHRRNILNHIFTHAGIGIASNPDGTLVITQNFIARPPDLPLGVRNLLGRK